MKVFTATVPRPPAQVRAEIDQVAPVQGWTVHPGAFVAVLTLAKGVSAFSWGSSLNVRVEDLAGSTRLTFEAREDGALVDWGRGRRGVEKLVSALGGAVDPA